MLEVIIEKLRQCKFKQLEHQFELEDLYKEILFECRYLKNLTNEQIAQRKKFLDDRIAQRKNLYIYPEQVNV